MSIKDKIDMKTIKIALAVVVSLSIGNLLKFESPYLTAITAMIAIQSTIYDSVSFGKDRVLGTVIGASVGLAIAAFLFNNEHYHCIHRYFYNYICL